jgi:hypothetical protein
MTKTLYQILNVPESASDSKQLSASERQLIGRYDEGGKPLESGSRQTFQPCATKYDRELLSGASG